MAKHESLKKGIAIIMALKGHEFNGLAPSEIAKACGISNSDVTNLRKTLMEIGLVEEVRGIHGRYRIGHKLIQISYANAAAIQRLRAQADEEEQRSTRLPD